MDSAERRMGKEDGVLGSHRIKCESEIDWGKSKIVAMETGYRQRKAREGIESLRELHGGKEILNNYEQLTVWQTVLNSYFKWEVTEERGLCVRTEITRDRKTVCTRQHSEASLAQQFSPAIAVSTLLSLFISLEIYCFHSQRTRKYLHGRTKSLSWLCYCQHLK